MMAMALWISDQDGKKLFMFDATEMPPRPKGSVDLSAGGHGWVTFSLDGRYAWCHTPDVFDVRRKTLVATLKDENGQPVAGSKFVEVHFRDGKVTRVGDQFGLGRASAPPAEAPASRAAGGWLALFDGKSFDGWVNPSGGKPSAGWGIENGALVRKTKSGDLWTRQRFGNFALALEFRTEGNSGGFIRTDKPRDLVQTGIEIQIDRPGKPGKHSVGAVYDALAPTENAATTNWNQMVITAKDNVLQVELNGRRIIDMDLDRWTEPGKNPDGTKNKFKKALRDFPREGHIGFQDHNAVVAYCNVRIKPL